MDETQPQFMLVGSGADARRIAYLSQPAAAAGKAGVVWLSGLKSDMTGTKAAAVAGWAREQGLACLRFDYSGHGQSEGRFEDGTVSRWLEETRAAAGLGAAFAFSASWRGVAVWIQRSRVIGRQHRRDTAGGGHGAPLSLGVAPAVPTGTLPCRECRLSSLWRPCQGGPDFEAFVPRAPVPRWTARR
jgi:pimeloyl-ACP methyl ester carboxylesterase